MSLFPSMGAVCRQHRAAFSRRNRQAGWRAFSLLELLVATAILLVVVTVLLQLIAGIGSIWKSSAGKVSAFQSARSAFTTIDRVLAAAMLNTYNDYVNSAGDPRTPANASNFSPTKFLRASELHFLSGPAADLVPGGSATSTPGQAIFFQAPLGEAVASSLGALGRELNSTGFYIRYGFPDGSLMPNWLQALFGSKKRFRLMQVVEPSDSLQIYASTAAPGYDTDWLNFTNPPAAGSPQPRERVLAEDVSLLVIRPRLPPEDEKASAGVLQETFSESSMGSLLSPDYLYDSRAWEPGYAGGITVSGRRDLMRNQVPPIVDVAMVALDRRSLGRFTFAADPPAELLVPAGLFSDSSKLEEDLTAYGQQLSAAGIRFRIFRTSIRLQGAKWSNN